jgi:branched-chain amino acid transport system substrate-binding protein
MNNTIKIGFLFPYSSIYPHISKDIIDGFMAAIPEKHKQCFQFFPEYIDQGKRDLIKTAINKFTSFHNVDIISGIISYKAIPDIITTIGQRKKIGFFFDMGEYLPPIQPLPTDLFSNSFLMWQLEYALGYWSQNTFRGKGAILMSVYDAGYNMHSSFWQGAINAGAEEIDMHTIPYDPQMKSILPVLPMFFEKIEKSKVEYLHVLLCGNEALEFYSAFKQSNLYGKLPLIVSPHMSSETIISKVDNLNITCYSASGWDYHSPLEQNQAFKRNYEASAGRQATSFAVLGYEAGLAFYSILHELQKNDFQTALTHLKNESITGPRGPRNFHLGTNISTFPIAIEKITFQPFKPLRMTIAQGLTMPYNHNVFSDIHEHCVSGWENPYLCI